MTRRIHLNGPPGIGKSTIAKVYTGRHPGVLDLDIDQVVALIGGWQVAFSDAFESGRILAAAMARTYLASGHDVVMPQLITNQREIADFEAAVTEAGAEYIHVVLMADAEASWARLSGRADGRATERDLLIDKIAEENGGPVFLQKIYSLLAEFVAAKRIDASISCGSQTPRQTCDALEAVLARSAASRPPYRQTKAATSPAVRNSPSASIAAWTCSRTS